jgi:hypothetical protein
MIEEDEYCDRKYCQSGKNYIIFFGENFIFTICERRNHALDFCFWVLFLTKHFPGLCRLTTRGCNVHRETSSILAHAPATQWYTPTATIPYHSASIACSRESLMEGHNSFLNQFVEIPRRSIIVFFLSLLAKPGLHLLPFEINCSWPPPHQSNGWFRAPPELVQNFADRRSSFRRTAARSHAFNMVWQWQYRSPIAVGREEFFSNCFYLTARRLQEG